MVMKNKNYNNLPVEVKNSVIKLDMIIKTIEKNINLPKDDILREITIKLGTVQKARKIFSLYYPIEGMNLSKYIVRRKMSQAVKHIKNIKDPIIVSRKIYEITGFDREYFNQKLKTKENMIEAFDVDEVAKNINNIYDNIYKLNDTGIIKAKIHRTKVLVEGRDWVIGLRRIFSMREQLNSCQKYTQVYANVYQTIFVNLKLPTFIKSVEW